MQVLHRVPGTSYDEIVTLEMVSVMPQNLLKNIFVKFDDPAMERACF